jgi:hypothetical protein
MSLVRFHLYRLFNFFIILFRRKRRLSVNGLNYFRYWRFSNAYLVIDFKASNAIWFKIGNLSGTDFNKPIVLDLNKINEEKLLLQFFGVFQKIGYLIYLKKDASLNSKDFKTDIKDVYKASFAIPDSKIHLSDINCIRNKPQLHQEQIMIQNHNIRVKLSHFNIEEHI